MRHFALPLVLGIAALTSACGSGEPDKFSFAVIGDAPYGTGPTDTSQLTAMPNLIKSINGDADVALVLHGGDIHSGKEYCTEAYDRAVYNLFTTFKAPLVYAPGDNEWADCHKAKEGGGTYNATTGNIDYVLDKSGNKVNYAGGDPVANLALVRSIFFSQPGLALGGNLPVHTQAREFDPAYPADSQFVENTWWFKSGVLFAATNIPGGSNNGNDPWYGAPTKSAAQTQEVSNRTGATLRWLKTAFDRAESGNASAVVLLVQADMWDLDGNVPSHIAEYKPYIDLIAARAKAFGKPVLLFNGDSHVYRSDNPLSKGASCVTEATSGAAATACTSDAYDNQPHGYNVPNFRRVTFHGSTTPMEWLKLNIDMGKSAPNGIDAFGPFSWKRTPVN